MPQLKISTRCTPAAAATSSASASPSETAPAFPTCASSSVRSTRGCSWISFNMNVSNPARSAASARRLMVLISGRTGVPSSFVKITPAGRNSATSPSFR